MIVYETDSTEWHVCLFATGKLYADAMGGEVYFLENGSVLIDKVTHFPYLRTPVTDEFGNVVLYNGDRILYHDVVLDPNGDPVLNEDGTFLFKKIYYKADGTLWLDAEGSPVYLDPLWNKDGTIALDFDGSILYTGVIRDGNGNEFVTTTGGLLPQVPIRVDGDLLYDMEGNVVFYMPYASATSGILVIDYVTGLPYFPSAYYQVPHNTYPLPVEEPLEGIEETGGFIE